MFGGKSCDGNSTDVDLCKERNCSGKNREYQVESQRKLRITVDCVKCYVKFLDSAIKADLKVKESYG